MTKRKFSGPVRDVARILIIDDSSSSKAAEKALREKKLFYASMRRSPEDHPVHHKPPCLITGEGIFRGQRMIEEYAKTIDRMIRERP